MSTSKNAYEIRLEILKEANSNVWNIYHFELDAAKRNAEASGDNSGQYFNHVSTPKPEGIIEYAEKLYKFVSRE
jgi:hypothetical protein